MSDACIECVSANANAESDCDSAADCASCVVRRLLLVRPTETDDARAFRLERDGESSYSVAVGVADVPDGTRTYDRPAHPDWRRFCAALARSPSTIRHLRVLNNPPDVQYLSFSF